jgi:hypothetical protein
MTKDPALSVVVTVVEGGAALERCLAALSRQTDAPAMEVIVPFDDTIRDVTHLAAAYPAFRFVDIGEIEGAGRRRDAYTQHMRYDCRRSAGLATARGRYVAMLEDRGWPRPDWAREMVALHEHMPHAAIGGAVENGAVGSLRTAVFHCDFGRYEPPLQAGDADYVTDINICYKRAALDAVRPLWEMRYQEVPVNCALRKHGLHLSDRPRVVQQRGPLRLGDALAERVQWGRTFGLVRGRAGSRVAALGRVAAAPLVPAVLLWRHVRKQLASDRPPSRFVPAVPLTLLLMLFWALGEAIGELEALRPGNARGGSSAGAPDPRGSV